MVQYKNGVPKTTKKTSPFMQQSLNVLLLLREFYVVCAHDPGNMGDCIGQGILREGSSFERILMKFAEKMGYIVTIMST